MSNPNESQALPTPEPARGTVPGTESHPLPEYRAFLAEVALEELRAGVDGLRIVGEGLFVLDPPITDSLEWETKFGVAPEPVRGLYSRLGNCATGCTGKGVWL